MESRPLEGRSAIVTGAGRGLGKAMAEALAANGARVALLDVDRDVLTAALADVLAGGGQGCAIALLADVTDEKRARDAVDEIAARIGGPDILVNDAAMGPQFFGSDGGGRGPKFWEVDPELWLRVVTVNAFGPQLMASVCVPGMIARGWGRIVNVTTSLNTMYLPGGGSYGPSKAALEANTSIMARDLEGTGVTANVLIPGGPANTRMIPDTLAARDALIQPGAMKAPAVWLCSSDSDGVNGMRFIAALWDGTLAREERIARAGAPTAWPQVKSAAIYPQGSRTR
jgi:NAD(P)-dependent dehydrogenase (short-subunit alcohol dehydrogenase family)